MYEIRVRQRTFLEDDNVIQYTLYEHTEKVDLSIIQKILCFIFKIVYRKWLWNKHLETYNKVLYVSGWRRARVATVANDKTEISRNTIEPCFWIFQ